MNRFTYLAYLLRCKLFDKHHPKLRMIRLNYGRYIDVCPICGKVYFFDKK